MMRTHTRFLKLLTATVCLLPVMFFEDARAYLLRSQGLPVSQTVETAETAPTALINEVWQIVNQDYIDVTFNGHDWEATRQRYVNRTYDSDEVYTAIQEMLAQLGDSFTRFMDPQTFDLMQVDSDREIGSIGLQIKQDKVTEEIVVVGSIEETPAFEAGVLAEDVLLSIDGVSTQGMNPVEATSYLRGSVGTTATLAIRRDGREQVVEVMREVNIVHPVRYGIEETPAGSIGYIRLSQFSSSADDEVQQAIQSLEPQVNGYVLDLRSNVGGLLSGAIDVAQMWLSEGTIVSFIDRTGEIEREQASPNALSDQPLVVLIDGGTASGSEILAAALQDNQRARIVGTRSAGYNSIQSIRALSDGSGVAVTVAKWLTPNRENISSTGLTPDVTVTLTAKQQQILRRDRTVGTLADPQFARAVELLIQDLQQ